MPTYDYQTRGTWNTIQYQTTASTGTATWQGWNQDYLTIGSAHTAATMAIWAAWSMDLGGFQLLRHTETAEQQQARIERERAAGAEARDAQERAWRLLRRHLRPDQRQTLRDHRYFDVLVGATGERRRYRIHEGVAGNVRLIGPDGRTVWRYCIRPRETVPVADVMLSQMLMLQAEEPEFLRIANVIAA